MKKHIPNSITLCNLSCGILAILLVVNNDFALSISEIFNVNILKLATAFIFLGAVFDFFDGFAARLLKAYSPLGKELDSLADLITFGFAPAAIVSRLMIMQTDNIYLPLIPYIIVLFSALRLAKFNVDTRQSESFIGLPTPANAIFLSGLVYTGFFGLNPLIILPILSVLFSLLLTSEIPMFSLKIKSASWKNNKLQYSFLLFSIVLISIFQLKAISLIILVYIGISIFRFLVYRKTI